ncbi:MAG: pyrroline-5-carboxylate reductase [Planctomycetia bacterium]|nr:MAG: pyrroline-5-carboxylate reductase [Planctomycetia bacterium]
MKLGFIGGGNMAQATIAAVLRAGLAQRDNVRVSEPDEARRTACRHLGVIAAWDNAAVAAGADIVILAVKPQVMAEALRSMAASGQPPSALLVSIAAGITTRWIEAQVPGARVVRVMPNTPLTVGAGVSVVCRGSRANDADETVVRRIFESGGVTLALPEDQFDAVTAVSGSGPAYFYELVECLSAAGAAEGLAPQAAELLARQTLIGAARLLEASGASAAQLRAAVTSPAGTTAAALESLDRSGFADIIRRAVQCAAARGAELARG